MPDTVDWERRGFNDFPNNHRYPTRDTYSAETENQYLTGWHKAARVAERDKVIESMRGQE